MEDNLKKMEDDLKKIKQEDDLKKKKEDDLKKEEGKNLLSIPLKFRGKPFMGLAQLYKIC